MKSPYFPAWFVIPFICATLFTSTGIEKKYTIFKDGNKTSVINAIKLNEIKNKSELEN